MARIKVTKTKRATRSIGRRSSSSGGGKRVKRVVKSRRVVVK